MDLDAETDPKHTELQTQSTLHNQINTTQTCWNTASMLYGKHNGGGKKNKKIFDADGKKDILLPKRTLCLIHSLLCTAADIQLLCTCELGPTSRTNY